MGVLKGRRGSYDVSLRHDRKEVLFEVKVATQNINRSFQFNGIRYDRQYTHLFCLGITPSSIHYLIVSRQQVGMKDYKMVSMAKGSNATFKLSRRIEQMKEFENFAEDVRAMLKSA